MKNLSKNNSILTQAKYFGLELALRDHSEELLAARLTAETICSKRQPIVDVYLEPAHVFKITNKVN